MKATGAWEGDQVRNTQVRTEGHTRDVEYYEAHYPELLAQYADQWIAILDGKVVGASEDAFKLMAQLEGDGVPANQVLRRHMTREAELLILPHL